jgi:hypothetical protein
MYPAAGKLHPLRKRCAPLVRNHIIGDFMDKYEAIGVLKTLIDSENSSYIIEALEMSIKTLQSVESTQTAHNNQSTICTCQSSTHLEPLKGTPCQLCGRELL